MCLFYDLCLVLLCIDFLFLEGADPVSHLVDVFRVDVDLFVDSLALLIQGYDLLFLGFSFYVNSTLFLNSAHTYY